MNILRSHSRLIITSLLRTLRGVLKHIYIHHAAVAFFVILCKNHFHNAMQASYQNIILLDLH